ncbi:threonine aldolase [bacterium 336/3]|nr:threonine aldolase [bacterium 336/3]
MLIDLRSDTVTKPTPAMLEAMFSAQVGDDVYEEDPTVKTLEEKTASFFGMEAGLFCTSGTMTNQIGIRATTEPNDEIICDKLSHIYNYEGGGLASNSLLSVRLVEGMRGRMTPYQIEENINQDNIHYPKTSIVALENTVNKGGGCFYTLPQIEEISSFCKNNHLKLHLDGARVWNSLVATQEQPSEYGKHFDTISVCFSKGLGCPVGSVLLGSKTVIKKAKRIRKVMGGGWRQAGYLAAAALYALDNHIERLSEDHKRAKELEKVLQSVNYTASVMPVDTNIIIFELPPPIDSATFTQKFAEKGVLVSPFSKKHIRLVTHLDFTDDMLEKTIQVIKNLA